MKQITVTLYEYKELNQKAQEKAHQEFNEKNAFHDTLYYQLMDWLEYLLKKNNIESFDHALYYSLSYSQGDGACFIGNFKWKGLTIEVCKNSVRYSHFNSVDFTFGIDPWNMKEGLSVELIKNDFIMLYQDICKNLEKIGYQIIDYENSEENFIGYCNTYECFFHKDGTIFNDET